MYAFVSEISGQASPNIYDVVDTQIHALLAKHPRSRYQIGFEAKLCCFGNLLPASITDYIVSKLYYGPLPYALKKENTSEQTE